jgi:hypothetical protein
MGRMWWWMLLTFADRSVRSRREQAASRGRIEEMDPRVVELDPDRLPHLHRQLGTHLRR